MIDITHKSNTLRIATAQAIVKVSSQDTIDAILNKTVPKGDVFSMSKAVGLLGVKNTPLILADCHPMPIEFTGIEYQINNLEISILVTVKTIYKTGVEVEAMHGASVVALNIYDMLKPIDKGIEIHTIKLLEKKGGKSDIKNKVSSGLTAAVVVCSDTISQGKNEDTAGKFILNKLNDFGVNTKDYIVIADEKELISQKLIEYSSLKYDLIIFTGGTGLSARDQTPDAILPLLDKEISGIMETARSYGQERMPYSMLSRGVAGIKGQSLVLTFPGSSKAVEEYINALFPHLFHIFGVLKGERH